jgi:cadmium resistance protein CadD (predicted permease)
MNHPWRKALIFLAISMIPVYIGLYLAMKQEKSEKSEAPANSELSTTPDPGQGHGSSF